jgi:hypothetical protein
MNNEREQYKKYLKDKRVCLVGPAACIKDLSQRELIDSYDVVVRINKALPVHEDLYESSGTKTNVLYNCLDPDPESGGHLYVGYLQQEIDWLVCPYPSIPPFNVNIQNFYNHNMNRLRFCTFEKEYYIKLSTTMGTRPNSGVLAILDLLSCEIKELYITGITFFKGGYAKEYRYHSEESVMERMRAHGNHLQEPQILFMKSALKNDKRIKMDIFLTEVIEKT